MKCLAVLLLTVAFCASPSSMGADKPRKIPCKTEANAKSCYWTHGRLMLHNGAPAFRLWKIGTHRMLAIWSGPSVDFEGCPLEPEKPNVMQAACQQAQRQPHLVQAKMMTREAGHLWSALHFALQ